MAPGKSKRRVEKRPVYNRVRVLRLDMDVSRAKMSEDLDIGCRTLGYIERQEYRPSLLMAWTISTYFDLPLDAVWSPEPMKTLSEEVLRRG